MGSFFVMTGLTALSFLLRNVGVMGGNYSTRMVSKAEALPGRMEVGLKFCCPSVFAIILNGVCLLFFVM